MITIFEFDRLNMTVRNLTLARDTYSLMLALMKDNSETGFN